MAGGVLYGPDTLTVPTRWRWDLLVDLHRNVGELEGAPFHVAGDITMNGSVPVITYTSRFGINSAGVPYYDPDGAVPGEDAILTIDDGVLSLTKLEALP